MQIGETIATIMAMQDEGKCVFCDQKHDEPKKETIKETAPSDSGWRRKTMKGIFEETEIKKSIYPNGKFPPTYKYQGHHCIALSSLVENANSKPKDKILRLNHFLKKNRFLSQQKTKLYWLASKKKLW